MHPLHFHKKVGFMIKGGASKVNLVVKSPLPDFPHQSRRRKSRWFDPWARKIPWRREW